MSILLKGYSTPKLKFCNLSLSPMWLQTRKSFVRLREHNVRYFDENREACESTIDCQVNNTVKAQKSMKDIVKIVHLLQEYFLYEKKTKKMTLFYNSSPIHTVFSSQKFMFVSGNHIFLTHLLLHCVSRLRGFSRNLREAHLPLLSLHLCRQAMGQRGTGWKRTLLLPYLLWERGPGTHRAWTSSYLGQVRAN